MTNDEGAVTLEYGLMITLIGLVAAVGVRLLAPEISALFASVTF